MQALSASRKPTKLRADRFFSNLQQGTIFFDTCFVQKSPAGSPRSCAWNAPSASRRQVLYSQPAAGKYAMQALGASRQPTKLRAECPFSHLQKCISCRHLAPAGKPAGLHTERSPSSRQLWVALAPSCAGSCVDAVDLLLWDSVENARAHATGGILTC